MLDGKLYITATPIGNLGDITLRALETFKNADYILCEDTRVTSHLLAHYQISKPLINYHHHSNEKKVKEIIGLLEAGKNLVLVTDAGTPGISDPGNQLVRVIASVAKQSHGMEVPAILLGSESEGIASSPLKAPRNDTQIVPIPGPSAVTTALSISGFPTNKFTFLGFPPHKNKRQKFFQEVAESKHTVVFYESPYRIKKCLQELSRVLEADREVVVCRELTKKFESVYRGTIADLVKMNIREKGEFVIIVNS